MSDLVVSAVTMSSQEGRDGEARGRKGMIKSAL